MGARDYWDRMLVYFGITEDPDAYEDDMTASPRASRPSPRRAEVADEWDNDDHEPTRSTRTATRTRPAAASAASATATRTRPRSGVAASVAGVGVVPPRTFNDAQTIADHFKRGVPVIVNLQQTDTDLAKRLIDFASGLTYGLSGGMQRIADKVFLLTPDNVEVTAEERAAMLESGFFNQS